MPHFSSDGTDIHFIDEGSGDPVLLIHGFASNIEANWTGPRWVETLVGAGHRVIAYDNRGHGLSEKPHDPARYGAALMAEDARRLLDHLNIARADVIGYSMGARIAAFLALAHPDRVRSAVFGGLGLGLIEGVGPPEPIIAALEAENLSDVKDPTGRSFRIFAERTGSDRQALAACMRSSRVKLAADDVARLQMSVLVAVGTRDTVAGSARDLAALMPNAEHFDIANRDHMLSVGDRGLMARVVAFLEEQRRVSAPAPTAFRGAEDNRLAADVYGTSGAPVVLLHGGGQTRHSWHETARRLSVSGFRAITVDQRGHGESDWVDTAAYHFHDFAADAAALMRAVSARFGRAPVVVGASLGGIASILAAAGDDEPAIESLVLVDITPRMDPVGVARILAFMGDRLEQGFETVEAAADAVAAYLPHRKKPRSLSGLKKNLRRDPDGRYRWHWDPRFLNGPRSVDKGTAHFEEELVEAAKRLSMPVLLVRGAESELVQQSHVREFLDLVPHARYVDVSGAGHMVAGDRNDVFAAAIIDFVSEFVD